MLLDTDILSEVLKQNDQRVLTKARQYLAQHQRLAFSAIAAYEIIRGLKASRATQQLSRFLKTLSSSDVYSVYDACADVLLTFGRRPALPAILTTMPISSSGRRPWNTDECWSPETQPTLPGFPGFSSKIGANHKL